LALDGLPLVPLLEALFPLILAHTLAVFLTLNFLLSLSLSRLDTKDLIDGVQERLYAKIQNSLGWPLARRTLVFAFALLAVVGLVLFVVLVLIFIFDSQRKLILFFVLVVVPYGFLALGPPTSGLARGAAATPRSLGCCRRGCLFSSAPSKIGQGAMMPLKAQSLIGE
jgi:hypothetical protein